MGKRGSKLKPEVLDNLVQTTRFSRQEIKEWYKEFARDFPTGFINADQFKELYGQFYPDGDAAMFAQHTFRVFDENGDGTIDFREFLTALSVTSRGTVDDKLKWLFSLYDHDGNGSISRAEMVEIIKSINSMVKNNNNTMTAEERVALIYSKMDQNDDGDITVEEFVEAAKSDHALSAMLHTDKVGVA